VDPGGQGFSGYFLLAATAREAAVVVFHPRLDLPGVEAGRHMVQIRADNLEWSIIPISSLWPPAVHMLSQLSIAPV
jgi:hypothetical protein